ncbi:MAG: septal ring lytic transglycosylase RlpA family protein [Candidatus Omnitrophota bacterium]
MKQGVRRWLALMMFTAVPLVSASPTSMLQEIPGSVTGVILTPAEEKESSMTEIRLALFGTASWYSRASPKIKKRTANGDIFDDRRMTCASWKFPFGTRLKITNLANGRSVICVVNDRGPAKRLGRVIDLTRAAFAKISNPRKGLASVSVQPLQE